MEASIIITVAILLLSFASCSTAQKPNIIFIVADDLGWNDVGFHNPSMITPNIDKLANSGVTFNQTYVQPVCSPSRTAFMTGIYPWKAGTQHYVIESDQPVCVPLDFKFLPQYLKQEGYSTHAIGKWHLGFCNWNCTPTFRGFDTYFGYYNGAEDYYTHKVANYLDYRDDLAPVWNDTGEYSAFRFSKQAVDIIANHKDNPFFIYLPFQSVHAPIQVPKKYEEMYPDIVNNGRRKFCGMVSALDDAVGNITQALVQHGLSDNTLIFFTADNGGELVAYGNNWPLRGGKHTVWEGGTRVTSFVSGVGIKKTGIYDGMMHAVDYVPTILSAAGLKPAPGIDGVDMWDSIRMGGSSKRSEFIYNLDDYFYPVTGHAAIRVNEMKLVDGYPGLYDGWYLPMNGTKDTPLEDFIYNEKAQNKMVWLFNLTADPLEEHNLASEMPDIVKKLRAKISDYKKDMVPANFPPGDPKSNPKRFGNVWSPGWC